MPSFTAAFTSIFPPSGVNFNAFDNHSEALVERAPERDPSPLRPLADEDQRVLDRTPGRGRISR